MSEIALHNRPVATDTLAAIMAIWERVLRISPIRADNDFFDLGGDSLLAFNLFLEIEKATGRTLPIAAIYEAATPAAFAEMLDQTDAPRFSPLVELKPGGSQPPLFIVHGIGGNVIELAQLGKAIDTDRPIYAIQAKGVDGVEQPLDRIEDMAAYNLAALRERQPRGPYFLAGYSFGGLVAMEMAQRLKEQGEDIALLAFIDSYAHPATFPKLARAAIRARIAIDAVRSMPPREAAAFFIDRLARKRKRQNAGASLLAANFTGAASSPSLRKVYESAFAALLRYQPRFYPGRITFVRPEISLFPINPARIWRKLAREFSIHTVSGNHGSMVKDDVESLAATLSGCLRNATGAR